MAVNYLYQKPTGDNSAEIAELETELSSLRAQFLAGKVRIQVSSGEVGSQSIIEIPVKERIEWVLNRLNTLDPDNYPSSETKRVSRTKLVGYGNY